MVERLLSTVLLAALGSLPGVAAQSQFRQTAGDTLPLGLPIPIASALADVDGDRDADLVILGLSRSGVDATLTVVRNDGLGAFGPAAATPVPNRGNLTSLAIGDVDADGDVDVIVGQSVILIIGGQTTLWLGDGAGGFTSAPAAQMPVDDRMGATGLALLDSDGDGDLDLFVCSGPNPTGQGLERLYVNDGLGTFTMSGAPMPQDGSRTWSPCALDVDGDGDPDLAMLRGTGGLPPGPGLSLYRNDGPAGFTDVTASALPVWTGVDAASMRCADVDGDGHADLLIARPGGDLLLLGDGQGAFVATVSSRLPANPATRSLVPCDVDGDGDLDLLAVTAADGPSGWTVPTADRVYENDGHGWFQDATAARLEAPTTDGRDALAGDLDADGDPDALILTRWRCEYRRNEAGRLTDDSRYRVPSELLGSSSFRLADLDGDGDVDLVGVRNDDIVFVVGVNDGNGRFATDQVASAPSRGFRLVDVDRDGDPDAVFSVDGQNRLWLNDGTGRFAEATAGRLPVASGPTLDLFPVDLDTDGDIDLVQTDIGPNYVASYTVLLNDGTGSFSIAAPGVLPAGLDGEPDLAVDVDADGDLDLCVGSPRVFMGIYPATLLINQGGTFTAAPPSRFPTIGESVRHFAAGDVDRDGDVDLLLGTAVPPAPGYGIDHLYLNQGDGSFVDAPSWLLPSRETDTTGLVLVDIDADGILDALESVASARFGEFGVLIGTASGGFVLRTSSRVDGADRLEGHLEVADLDGDGDVDFVTAGPVVMIDHHQQLHVPSVPRLGGRYVLDVSAEPGYGSTGNPVRLWYSSGRAAVPLEIPPFGGFGLDPALWIPELPRSTQPWTARCDVPVPADPALLGVQVCAQALVYHRRDLQRARFSNTVCVRVGR
ncbi:MAG: VCBS repeat-containing protein [Planctomycetes bacterium]|nr:VCBS repeat-containing protein [Planctomycetota bacterium]